MISFNTVVVLVSTALLGALSGLAGSYSVLRRRALAGDALAHAALPGVFLSFLLLGSSNLLVLLSGALCTGIAGVAATSGLRRFTRIREDAAICIVLGVFFGGGLVLSRFAQNIGGSSKAGLDLFFLGATAGFGATDALLVGGAMAVCSLLVLLLYKEFKLSVFDARLASLQGWPVRWLELVLMAFVAVAVVTGLPQIGAVMMAAMLILPAATARLWTDRFGLSIVFSTLLGALAGSLGGAISLQYERLPAGPIIVLVGAAILLGSLVIAPRRGLIVRAIAQRRWRRMFDAVRLRFETNEAFWPRDVSAPNQQTAFIEDITHRESTVFHRSPENKRADLPSAPRTGIQGRKPHDKIVRSS